MNATIALRPQHSVRWIGAVLLVAAIVATVVLSITVFTANDAPATPTPVSHTSGIDTGCVHLTASLRAC
jgi:hypothetical protein